MRIPTVSTSWMQGFLSHGGIALNGSVAFNIYMYFCVLGEYHVCHSFCYFHVITSRKFQLKQTWRLMKAIAEVELDTEQTMKLEQL